ncbi:hypothetical protein [Hyalangium versicolor]|uniref:hypothetical protein n=1 Tax=Hyalangium versicolor TaxID=2861190 RepID=UPI001CCB1CC2|nr:hypothetical protein [Hyalangium versicolor]
MIITSKHELVRTIREMARTRKVQFDNSGAFLFNSTALNEQKVLDILTNATEGVVTIHHDRADLNKYSVTSPVHDAEIFLDADVRTELWVRAILPINFYK